MNATPPLVGRARIVAMTDAERVSPDRLIVDDPHETSTSTVASRKAVRAWFASTIGTK